MKRKFILSLAVALNLAGTTFAMKPVTIVDQGSFMTGGKIISAAGVYDDNAPLNYAEHTLNGYGQSAKSWETTPDDRDGFQNIFLEKKFLFTLLKNFDITTLESAITQIFMIM